MSYCTPDGWPSCGRPPAWLTSRFPRRRHRRLPGFEDLWKPLERGVGPSGAYVASLPAQRQAAVKQELRQRLGVADGPFDLTARAWIATGRVR